MFSAIPYEELSSGICAAYWHHIIILSFFAERQGHGG